MYNHLVITNVYASLKLIYLVYLLNIVCIANTKDLCYNKQTSIPGSNNFASTEI